MASNNRYRKVWKGVMQIVNYASSEFWELLTTYFNFIIIKPRSNVHWLSCLRLNGSWQLMNHAEKKSYCHSFSKFNSGWLCWRVAGPPQTRKDERVDTKESNHSLAIPVWSRFWYYRWPKNYCALSSACSNCTIVDDNRWYCMIVRVQTLLIVIDYLQLS